MAEALRQRKRKQGRVWHMDEMWIGVGVVVRWLWRAINEYGEVLDVLLQNTRCNQPNVTVSVLDIDPGHSDEDRRTSIEPVFVPTLGRNDEPQPNPDDLIDRHKEGQAERLHQEGLERGVPQEPSDDEDIPF